MRSLIAICFLTYFVSSLAQADAGSQTSFAPYTVVNGAPQFSADDENFSFYWSLWRGLTAEEDAALKPVAGGALLAERTISWTIARCEDHQVLHQAKEKLWFLDTIRFDAQGLLMPIAEAPREGYLYIGMGTVNSLGMRGIGAYAPLRRQPHEPHPDFESRQRSAYENWRRQNSAKGTYGSLVIAATHRLFAGESTIDRQAFVDFASYAYGGASDSRYDALRADRWPVYHDERAHKPHTLDEPRDWSRHDWLSEHVFRARLVWDWCQENAPVKAQLYVASPGLPVPGPTRPDRPDAGTMNLPIIVDDAQAKDVSPSEIAPDSHP